jgi:uncharacterized protein (DUF2249 family)
MTTFVDLDVRPILRAGGEPFAEIMRAVAALAPGQGLRLYATFKPAPLFKVLGSQGFEHEARELEDGEWEVLFTRPGAAPAAAAESTPAAATPADDSPWPDPVQHLDNRELDPPEPMVRILAATEGLQEGEVLSALLCREPMFLFPELKQRGHRWQGGFEPDGTTYKVLIRVGKSQAATA